MLTASLAAAAPGELPLLLVPVVLPLAASPAVVAVAAESGDAPLLARTTTIAALA